MLFALHQFPAPFFALNSRAWHPASESEKFDARTPRIGHPLLLPQQMFTFVWKRAPPPACLRRCLAISTIVCLTFRSIDCPRHSGLGRTGRAHFHISGPHSIQLPMEHHYAPLCAAVLPRSLISHVRLAQPYLISAIWPFDLGHFRRPPCGMLSAPLGHALPAIYLHRIGVFLHL